MITLAVSGALGRMGKRIIHLAKASPTLKVKVGLEREDHPECPGTFEGISITADTETVSDCDCLIEFTTPEVTMRHADYVSQHALPLVIGTTGLTQEHVLDLKEKAKRIPIVFSPNMSVGVNLLFRLIKESAALLKEYSVYIEEAHHIHKKDSPSGTAKRIVDIVNKHGFTIQYEDVTAIREDEIVGDHTIVFKSDVDEIKLSHSAKTRDIFARGALTAAAWIVKQKRGFYSMADILFSKK